MRATYPFPSDFDGETTRRNLSSSYSYAYDSSTTLYLGT